MNRPGLLGRLGRQWLTYGAGQLAARLLAFITIPVLTRSLTLEQFGALGLMTAVAGLMTFVFPMGANVLFGNDYVTAPHDRERRTVLSTMVGVSAISGLLWVGLALAASGVLAGRVLGEPEYTGLLRIAVVYAGLASLHYVGMGYLQVHQRARTLVAIPLVSGVLNAGTVVAALIWWDAGVAHVLWIGAGAHALTAAGYLATMWRDLLPVLSGKYLREILRLGLPSVAHNAAFWALLSLDLLFLQRLASETEVGLYAFAYKFGFVVNVLVYAFSSTWGPHVARTLADPPPREAEARLFGQPYRLAVVLLVTAALGLALFAPEVARLLGPSSYDAAWPAIPWIILGSVFLGLYYSVACFPMFAKQHRWLPLTTGGAALLNGALNWWLIPEHGMMAAAVTTAASYAVLFVVTLILARATMRVPLPVGRGVLVLLIGVGSYLVCDQLWPAQVHEAGALLVRGAVLVAALAAGLQVMFPGRRGLVELRELVREPRRSPGLR